jgi:hypothetical protein
MLMVNNTTRVLRYEMVVGFILSLLLLLLLSPFYLNCFIELQLLMFPFVLAEPALAIGIMYL